MSKISKAQRDEERKREAVRRMRLHSFVALLIPTMYAWELGMRGGGRHGEMTYQAVEVPPQVARYVRMQAGRIDKARDAVVRMLGVASFERLGKNFFQTADDKLQELSLAIINALPPNATHADELRVLTYLLHTAFHDFCILTDETRPEVKKLVSVLGTLANYLIKEDSHLVMPMNKAYYATRNAIQGDDTVWYEVNWDNAPQEVWLKNHAA